MIAQLSRTVRIRAGGGDRSVGCGENLSAGCDLGVFKATSPLHFFSFFIEIFKFFLKTNSNFITVKAHAIYPKEKKTRAHAALTLHCPISLPIQFIITGIIRPWHTTHTPLYSHTHTYQPLTALLSHAISNKREKSSMATENYSYWHGLYIT